MGRKYRQQGYMSSDSDRERSEKKTAPKREYFGPKSPAMPGKREVVRCASCATILPPGLGPDAKCLRCGQELHSCKMCTHFDTSARFECTETITARIPKKDARNECNFYTMRTTIERETSTSRPLDARAAFENLFRK